MMNQNIIFGISGFDALGQRLSSGKAFRVILPLVFLSLTVVYMVSLGYHLAKTDGTLYTGSDGTLYIILAEALSSGRGYREIHLVGEPSSNVQPGLPLLLVPIVRFLGRNILVIKLLITIIGLLSAWCLYILLKDMTGRKLALVIAFLYGINVQTIFFSNKILTEIPYLCFSLFTLVFMRRYFEEKEFSIRTGFLCILFIWLSYFTRALGISLLAAFILYFVIERHFGKTDRNVKQVLLTVLVIAIPIGLWAYRSNMAQAFVRNASGGYGATVGIVGAATNMLKRMEAHISIHFVANSFAPVVIYGIGWCLLRRRTVVEYYVIIFILILSIITGPAEKYTGDTMQHVRRYLVPMTPFTLYYFIIGVKSIIEALVNVNRKQLLRILAFISSISLCVMAFYVYTGRGIVSFLFDYLSMLILCAVIAIFGLLSVSVKRLPLFSKHQAKLGRIVFYFLIGLVILNDLFAAVSYIAGESGYRSPDWDEYVQIAEWVNENTNIESIVMCRKPRLFYYWTGRKMAVYPFSSDTSEVMNSIHDQNVDYVVVDSFQLTDSTRKYLIPALKANEGKFSVVYRRGRSLLMRVESAGKGK